MNLNIRFKGLDASDSVKQYLEDRTTKLAKFLPPTTTINATLEEDSIRKIAEINLRHKGAEYVAKQSTENLMSSIDEAVDKLLRQLQRSKDKKTNRPSVPVKEIEPVVE